MGSSTEVLNILDALFQKIEKGEAAEEIAKLFNQSVDWDVPGAIELVPWVGKRSSNIEIAKFYKEIGELIKTLRFDIHKILSDEESAVVIGSFECKVLSTQKIITSEFSMYLKIFNGKIHKYRFFEDSYAVAMAIM